MGISLQVRNVNCDIYFGSPGYEIWSYIKKRCIDEFCHILFFSSCVSFFSLEKQCFVFILGMNIIVCIHETVLQKGSM
jgi:hypothetical protein